MTSRRVSWRRSDEVLADELCTLSVRPSGLSMRWTVDGAPARALSGCSDVDLGCSPSTNTLPIRRLRLAIGASHSIKAAWIRFPELQIVKAEQTYTRLDE